MGGVSIIFLILKFWTLIFKQEIITSIRNTDSQSNKHILFQYKEVNSSKWHQENFHNRAKQNNYYCF